MSRDINDFCPVCGEKFSTQCRCRRNNKSCPNHHNWHVCPVHKTRIMGTGHDVRVPFGACSCPRHSAESPGHSTFDDAPLDGGVSFVFDLDDPVVKFN